MQSLSVSLAGLSASALLLSPSVVPQGEAFAIGATPAHLGRLAQGGARPADLREPGASASPLLRAGPVSAARRELPALKMLSPQLETSEPEGIPDGIRQRLASLMSGNFGVSRPTAEKAPEVVSETAQAFANLCDPAAAESCSLEGNCGISSIIECLEKGDYDQNTCQRLTYALCESGVAELTEQTYVPDVAIKCLADADLALVEGRMQDALAAFDEMRQWFSEPACVALEKTMGMMLQRTPLAFFRKPEAILPSEKPVPPDSYRGGYHGTAHVPPSVALKQGLAVRGPNTHLLDHVMETGGTAFRGATPTVSDPNGMFGAALWANEGGWVYDIRQVPTWNADMHLQGRRAQQVGVGYSDNLLSGEVELTIPGYIPPEKIKRYGQVEIIHGIPRVRTWHDNPSFGKS